MDFWIKNWTFGTVYVCCTRAMPDYATKWKRDEIFDILLASLDMFTWNMIHRISANLLPCLQFHSEPKQAFFLYFLGFLWLSDFLWLQGAFIFATGNWHWHWHFCIIIIIVSLLYSQGIEHLIFSVIMSMSYLSILTNKKGKARLATSSVVSIEDIRKEWRRSAVEEVVLIRLSFSTTLCELTKNENYKKI